VLCRQNRDHDAIAHAATTDGIYPLATNQPGRLTALTVLRQYKDQQIVERRHRDAKHTLKVRPIFLHNDDRIRALISTVGLAPLIFGLIETQTRNALTARRSDGLDRRQSGGGHPAVRLALPADAPTRGRSEVRSAAPALCTTRTATDQVRISPGSVVLPSGG
jgi:hypothetical protein